jgi:hypothetical protein
VGMNLILGIRDEYIVLPNVSDFIKIKIGWISNIQNANINIVILVGRADGEEMCNMWH